MTTPSEQRYAFGFAAGTPYGHAVDLLRLRQGDHHSEVILDLGCGFGAIAEPVEDLGFSYVGIDVEGAGVESLRSRGMEAHVVDLADPAALGHVINDLVGPRRVFAITMLDFLEHVPSPRALLASLEECFPKGGTHELPLIVLSVPNVGHYDIAAKLLLGIWDVSATGLLDETHLSWFTSGRLTSLMSEAGYQEVSRKDFSLAASDQAFPWDLASLASTTPLSSLLRRIRREADEFGWVNQFVRVYERGAGSAPPQGEQDPPSHVEPFLSVIMRTQGRRRQMLGEALLCLMAQTDDDFEVILCVHTDDSPVTAEVKSQVSQFPSSFAARVNVIEVSGGSRGAPLNAGLKSANGRYVAFLDDDDLVTANWVEAFHRRAATNPGQVLRSVTGTQTITAAARGEYLVTGRVDFPYPSKFDPVRHLYSNSTPICSIAIPMVAIRANGAWFDESLAVLEDWDFLMRVSNTCGVSDTWEATSIYHLWAPGQASSAAEPEALWMTCRDAVHARLNDMVLLLPRGSASSIAQLVEDGTSSERLHALDMEVARLRGETAQQYAEIAWLRKHGLRGLMRDAVHALRQRFRTARSS